MAKLTESQRRALEILKKYGPLAPREFARRMWPDSPGWRRRSKCGPYGVTKGGGMPRAGGAYLGKLCKKGWVEWGPHYLNEPRGQWDYWITNEGKDALRAHEEGG